MKIKKVRIYALAVLILLLVYSGFMGIFYKASYEQAVSSWSESSKENELYELYNEMMFSDEELEDLELSHKELSTPAQLQECIYSLAENGYASAAYVYDDSGKLIAKTSNYITFIYTSLREEYYVPLDEYLTDELRSKLYECYNEYSENYYTFKFALDGDKVIPCSLQYKYLDPYTHPGETVTFSDTEPTDEVDAVSSSLTLHINDIIFSNKKKSDYELVQSKFEDGTVKVSESTDSYGDNEISSEELNTGTKRINKIKSPIIYKGETCGLYLCSATSLYKDAFNDYTFQRNALITTSILIVCLVITLGTISSLLKKIQMKQAKYAFSNAAAHELKTPLAIIQNRCELVMENVNPAKNGEYIKSLYEESIRMNRLVRNLLQYNSLSMAAKIDKTQCDFDRMIKKEMKKYDSLAYSKQVTVKASTQKFSVKCNEELLSLVIDNFLSNAIKFAEPKTAVKVSMTKRGKTVRLGVFNTGKEIEKGLGNSIWDILYKSEEARTNDNGSSGMGLALSKQILELHGFKYGYENKDGGVEFYFITK